MRASGRLLLLALTIGAATAWGQSGAKVPHIGYLYPAGGQQGTVFEVVVGGQYLAGATDVYVTGDGVQASVVQYGKAFNRKEIGELRGQLAKLLSQRKKAVDEAAMAEAAAALPDHPLLRNLDRMTVEEMEYWANLLFKSNKVQPNAQIAEMVLLEVAIEPGAAPGDRELRLGTRGGLTNPLCFQVGALPEVSEREPNDPKAAYAPPPEEPPIDLPVLLNGQIMPGDVDLFRFQAQQGQQLVIEAQARRFVPYLADAVPGWFQAVLTLYDAKGNEVAFADDYRFDPDPVLCYEVPEDGEFTLEIRDAIYRGREDFVYRIALGELPFVTQMFPLGGEAGKKTVAELTGWNLPEKKCVLDTEPGGDELRQTVVSARGAISNVLPYAVDTLPESKEKEPNNTPSKAQHIALPRTVNGRISEPGDVDVYRFRGHKDDKIVAEIVARRLNSPLDSVLRLSDASGKVLAWNDDYVSTETGYLYTGTGRLTHHADSYLCAQLPEDGDYCIEVADAQHQGADAFGYRLRLSQPRPDFALRMTPSSLTARAGRATPFCVHVLRKDGFDGDVEIVLKDPPAGLSLDGRRIPSGKDHIRMTLTATAGGSGQPVVLQLEGRAVVDGETVCRPVVPSEDMMQAFLYRHLAPAQELLVSIAGPKKAGPPVVLADDGPVRIPAGGTAQVRLITPPKLPEIQLELSDPPPGMTLEDAAIAQGSATLTLKAEGDALKPGYADNLIVSAFTETTPATSGPKPAKTQRTSLGVLPAIPFEIVQP